MKIPDEIFELFRYLWSTELFEAEILLRQAHKKLLYNEG